VKSGTSLPRGVVQSDFAPEIADKDVFLRLNKVVRQAAAELSALRDDPVAVAASPNRFDDAWTYEWQAVRCGTFFSEKQSYMQKCDLDRDIIGASETAKSAHGVLKQLEEAGWRDLFAAAFNIDWSDQSLALVVQSGLTWLVFSSNNVSEDGDPVFAIWDDQPMSYFGEARDRFDWAIQDERPLVFVGVSGEHILA